MTAHSTRYSRTQAALGLLLALVLAWPQAGRGSAAQPPSGLKIVVIEGEDAVNIIQQKTAVAPIVEVRDRNDQPVAGVLVRFTVRGSRGATFSGRSALSVTTNQAGRATAAGLTPTSNGAFQVDVSASFQGQTATTTINQTNFATPADAAKAGSTSSSTAGAAAGGAAAGAAAASAPATASTSTGGGMSGAKLALIGAGVGAGALGIVSLAGGGDGGGGGTSPGTGGTDGPGGSTGGGTGGSGSTQNLTVSGPFTLQTPLSWTYVGGLGSCTMTDTTVGTIRMTLQVQPSGVVTGTSDMTGTSTTSGLTCSFQGGSFPAGGSTNPAGTLSAPVTGTASNLAATQTFSVNDAQFSYNWQMAFVGALSNGVVTGTLRETNTWVVPNIVTSMGGTGSTTVTLR